MKKTILLTLTLISILLLLVRFTPMAAETILGVKARSGISVLSQPSDASVFIDNEEVGRTPYDNEDLEVKEYLVRLEKEGAVWQGKVKLNKGTISVVNRSLSTGIASSSGEILSLEKGRGMTVVSNPTNADIELDGKIFGKSPLTINIEPGDHTLIVTHPNFLKRSIRAKLPEDHHLTVSVDLALSEADLTAVTTPIIEVTRELVVKKTPTNFLRVRETPSLSGKELARVKPGDILILLEEEGEWMKVKTDNEIEGYVSAEYVEEKKAE